MSYRFRILLPMSVVALIGLVEPGNAQSFDVFGGFTTARMKSDATTNSTSMNGWNTSITGYLTPRFGLTADFAGFYNTVNPTLTGSNASTSVAPVDLRQYSFMAGPQFRLLRKSRFEASVRALFGGAHGYIADPSFISTGSTYNSFSQTTFATLVGTNFDVNLSKRVAIRFSPGLYLTQFGNETQTSFRFSVGPVFRFGSRE